MSSYDRGIAAKSEIVQLEAELKRKKDNLGYEQRRCQHTFGEGVYDPETTQELVADYSQKATHYDIPTPGRWVDKTISRWSRTCSKCGKKEYTTKQKTVKTAPDFG